MGYSILGDCANTASRLEGLNKHLGTHVLASQAVVAKADDLLLRPLGRFVLVGKAAPIPVVEVIAQRDNASDAQIALCARFAEALEIFQQTQWAQAAKSFEAILADHPTDGPSRFYLARCRNYQEQAPRNDDATAIYMDAK
jgi:adenylate cyclase